jgi:hypothetical protein
MKKKIILFVFGFICLSSLTQAQVSDPADGGEVGTNNSIRLEEMKKGSEKQLHMMLMMADKRNYPGFVGNVVYSGPTAARNLRTPLNYEDAFDKLEGENMLNRVRSWMEKAAIYHLNEFTILGSKESAFYSWVVEFATEKGKVVNHKFNFYLLGGKFLLASVE